VCRGHVCVCVSMSVSVCCVKNMLADLLNSERLNPSLPPSLPRSLPLPTTKHTGKASMGQTPSSSSASSASSSSSSFLAIHAVAKGCCQRWGKKEMRGLMRRMKARGARSVSGKGEGGREESRGGLKREETEEESERVNKAALTCPEALLPALLYSTAFLPPSPPSLPPSLQGKPTLIYRCDLETAVKETGLSGTTEAEILGK